MIERNRLKVLPISVSVRARHSEQYTVNLSVAEGVACVLYRKQSQLGLRNIWEKEKLCTAILGVRENKVIMELKLNIITRRWLFAILSLCSPISSFRF